MSEDKKWDNLTRKQKNTAKNTAAAAGCLIFWGSLTRAGKWSLARWWIIYLIYYNYIDGEIEPMPLPLFIWIIFGFFILYKFREKIFK